MTLNKLIKDIRYHSCGVIIQEKVEAVNLWEELTDHTFGYCPQCEVYIHEGQRSLEINSPNAQGIADYLNKIITKKNTD